MLEPTWRVVARIRRALASDEGLRWIESQPYWRRVVGGDSANAAGLRERRTESIVEVLGMAGW